MVEMVVKKADPPSYLSQPRLKFLCWTRQYTEDTEEDSLTSLPPNVALGDFSRITKRGGLVWGGGSSTN